MRRGPGTAVLKLTDPTRRSARPRTGAPRAGDAFMVEEERGRGELSFFSLSASSWSAWFLYLSMRA
jgi:hypothetical protein